MTEKKKTTTKKASPSHPLIYQAMANIMSDVEGLTKDRTSQGGFKYRGIDDMYNYLHDTFAKHNVFSTPTVLNMTREERKSSQGKTLIYTLLNVQYHFFAVDGSFVTSTVIGEAFDTGDKSASKALAIAHKYALFQITMLPTLLPDPDADVHTVDNTGGTGAPPQPHPEPVPLATREQHDTLADYRKIDATTGEINDYLDERGDQLTAKQATQLINLIEKEIK